MKKDMLTQEDPLELTLRERCRALELRTTPQLRHIIAHAPLEWQRAAEILLSSRAPQPSWNRDLVTPREPTQNL